MHQPALSALCIYFFSDNMLFRTVLCRVVLRLTRALPAASATFPQDCLAFLALRRPFSVSRQLALVSLSLFYFALLVS